PVLSPVYAALRTLPSFPTRRSSDLFYTNYDGIQLNVQTGASPVYENAGNAKMKGGELEMQSLLARGLTLNFAGAYIDAYYTYVRSEEHTSELQSHLNLVCRLLLEKK